MRAAAIWLLAISPVTTASCLATGEDVDADGEGEFSISVSASDTAMVLDLVNYPGVDRAVLDDDGGLDARAAAGIIAHRDGGDGLAISTDDDRFDSLAELDAVRYVGDAALKKLLAFARIHPVPPSVTLETVAFAGWETEAVVWGVNQATFAELDALLDARAASALIARAPTAGAPYASLDQIAVVAYVGPAALTSLRTAAQAWWHKWHPTRQQCTASLAPRVDYTASDFTLLLGLATTGDYPFAEVVAMSTPDCVEIRSTPERDALTAALIDTRAIDWGYDPFVAPGPNGDFVTGGAAFTAMVQTARIAIDERVRQARWVPTGDDLDLYNLLPAMVTGLTSGPAANPGDYVELRLRLEASECSQHAVALLQRSTHQLWIAHTYPGC